LNPIPFWAFEIEPYSALSYSKVLQPNTRVPGEIFKAKQKFQEKKTIISMSHGYVKLKFPNQSQHHILMPTLANSTNQSK
jgi:hypothetical protein